MDTQNTPPLSNDERRRQEKVIWRRSFLAAVVLHLALLMLWRSVPVPISSASAAGPRAGDDQAAKGSMEAVNLAAAPRVVIVPPPVPLPTIDPIEPVEFDDEQLIDVESDGLAGLRAGMLSAPGLEDGTGAGDGGRSDEGLFTVIPPNPRGMIIPPSSEELKGEEVEVWLFVDATGRVVPDSTVLRPPTADRSYNRRLIREAAEWVFDPARKAGAPVAAWTSYRISM
jgi:hypothetical protein